MATIEKYFNPFSSDVLITSVFHGSFKEKGNELIQKAGFRAGIVIFKGLEGSVQPSLARGTRLLASYQNREGLVVEGDFEIRPEQFGFSICPDNKERKISPEDSKRLLIEYLEAGATSDSYYNQRAVILSGRLKVLCTGLNLNFQRMLARLSLLGCHWPRKCSRSPNKMLWVDFGGKNNELAWIIFLECFFVAPWFFVYGRSDLFCKSFF
ncbi:MAG: hypothetical protein IPK68_11745 [Bdellovibrionales bacterium]|nr:hypothetical protein [Bdellovibrionales bacterium]